MKSSLAEVTFEALVREAHALHSQGDYTGAASAYRRAITLRPGDALLRYNLGSNLRNTGLIDDAVEAYRQGLRLANGDPNVRFAIGSALLSLGRYAEAWPHYEARYEAPGLVQPKPGLPFPEWRGEDLAGRSIAVFPEQGFGDQIQFSRFVGRLKRMASHVTLLCYPELHRLFAASYDVNVVAAAGSVSFPDPDFWTTVTSLPARLGVTLDDLDGAAYLSGDFPPRRALPKGFKVGLVVSGNPHHRNDANRSLDAQCAAVLKRLPAQIIDLDPKRTGARDFADTAAIISKLDLVITVDTSVAHLAGALGTRCWVMTPAVDTDWRWLRDRSDSPWYASVRLYRQPAAGRWMEVVAAIAKDLDNLVIQSTHKPTAPE